MIVISACTVGLAIYSGAGRQEKQEIIVGEGISNQSVAPSRTVKYMLREYQGRLAVFTGENKEPDMVFDVYIHYLPEADRELLKQGIAVENYEQLTKLIEDYIS